MGITKVRELVTIPFRSYCSDTAYQMIIFSCGSNSTVRKFSKGQQEKGKEMRKNVSNLLISEKYD